MLRRLACVACLIVLALPGEAQICPEPGQLLTGCSMDDVANDWNLLNGSSLIEDGGEGDTDPPAAVAVSALSFSSGPSGGGQEIFLRSEQCIPVNSSQTYYVGGSFRLVSGSLQVCQVGINTYSGSDCSTSGSGLLSAPQVSPTASWQRETWDLTTAVDTVSLAVNVVCQSAGTAFTIAVDDVWFAATELDPPLFADGFETGDTTRWSVTVP